MKYFIIENEQQTGPFTLEELQEKGIKSHTMVWKEGMDDWTPAWHVEELKEIIFGESQPVTPPPYMPKTAAAAGMNTAQETTPPVREAPNPPRGDDSLPLQDPPAKRKKGCGCTTLFTIAMVVAALAALMAITCPDKQAHRKAIEEKIATSLEASVSKQGSSLLDVGIQLIKDLFAMDSTDDSLDDLLDYHSYFVVSRTTVDMNGKPQTVSWGAFGKVITVNTDDLASYLESGIPVREIEKEVQSRMDDAAKTDAGTQPNDEGGLAGDIGKELINSMGKIVKKQVKEHSDSTMGNAWGKIIDGVTDIIKENAQ